MAIEYRKISYKELGRGIDARSAPNAIPEGYSEVLQNADVSSNGYISKRVGWEGAYGYLPIRVMSVTHSGTQVKFVLDGTIDTKSLQSSPLVVQGRLSTSQSGDWSTADNVEYYPSFTTDIPDTLPAGVTTTYSLAETRHGVDTDNVFIAALLSTSPLNDNSEWFYAGASISDTDPYDVTFSYSLDADTSAYLYVVDKDTVGGDSYVDETSVTAGTTGVISIPAASHQLDNFNIINQTYYLDGTDWVQFFPDSFTINGTTGDVEVTVTNSSASDITVKTVLSAAASTSLESASVAAGEVGTITISAEEDFYFLSVYSNVAGVLTQVIPDSISRDDEANTITITITNSTATNQTYEAYYEFATLTSSTIVVEDNSATSATYADTAPQMTLWGIPHSELYSTSATQEGHVTHIDTYRREGEERVVVGLGGNIFTSRTRTEAGDDYLIPSAEVDLESRVAADTDIGPAFQVTGSSANRTRGMVYADDVVENRALVTGVELVSSGVTKYTLQLTGKSGTLSACISSDSGLPDFLTVTGMAHDVHNGTFEILSVSDVDDTITVSNSAAVLADFDETGAAGRAGVFSDQITAQADLDLVVGDQLLSSGLRGITATIQAISGATVVVGGVTTSLNLAQGVRQFAQRTSSVVPMASTTSFVRGDMCAATDLTRRVRVKYVNPNSAIAVSSITSDGTTATVSVGVEHNLSLGQKVFLTRTTNNNYDGEHTITGIPSADSFEFASTETETVAAGRILGNTIELDEELTFADDGTAPFTLSVVGRWIPAEAPGSADDLPPATFVRHLDANDYTEQPTVRSAMVADTLFLTNQADEVLKFDGTSLYQAGLFRWQPQLFAQVDTGTASIPLSVTSSTVSAVSANRFTVGTGEAAQFQTGDRVTHSQDSASYVVQSVDIENGYVYVTATISGTGSGTLKPVKTFKYYFRLNAIDANQNVIASAVTGADDFVVDLTAAGQIHMRLVGPPAWGNLDFDALELSVYRTKANTSGPFYLLRNLDVNFNSGDGYIDVYDGTIDDLLMEFDNVVTALKGSELGTGWTQPLRAKYVTSADNRLILANLKDYPQLDVVLRKQGAAVSISAADLAGKRFLFRKNSADTATTTSMADRVGLEFVNSGAVTITPATDISRTDTTFTIASTAHGLSAGDWVYLFHAAAGIDNDLNFAGWWQIASVPDADSFTVNFNNSYTPSAADVDSYVTATAPADVPVWLGTDGNYNQLDLNTVDEFTAMLRLANAINTTQRMADVSGFTPWMIAQAGSELGVGRLVVRQEGVFADTMEVLLPETPTTGAWFVQGIRRSGSTEVSASTQLFGSRLIASYPNYPEVFDNPYGSQSASDSVIDVNPADGEEITGVIPFFGESVFGDGMQEAVIVVFKTNSIYLLDLNTKQISKIQSRGLGCTAPYSIASTKDGVMFANQSGVYRLNRDQSISYVGKFIERIWQDDVNRDLLSAATGHHYGVGSKYKLSVPVGQDTNNQVLVYDHQREGREQEFGAWTVYTNHAATGWANLGNDAYFATTDGQVFRLRNAGDETDFRDDDQAVAEMVITLRADDFGISGARKVINGVVSHFHLRRSDMLGTTLYSSEDLDGQFSPAGTFSLEKDGSVKVETVNASLGRRRCVYTQLKYVNNTKDEDVVLAGVDFEVGLLSRHGITDI